MRLDKELGALNSEILSIKEKWKIALNIDKKKIAIERLISMRRVRDKEQIESEIKDAVKEEELKIQKTVIHNVENIKEEKVKVKEEKEIEKIEVKENIITKSSILTKEKPPHLTVDWLKRRLVEK